MSTDTPSATSDLYLDREGEVWRRVHDGSLMRLSLGGYINPAHPFDMVELRWGPLHELVPAPLREEWAARYVNGGGAVCRTRSEAEAALDRMTRDSHRHRVDEPPAPEIAGIYARYVSDWVPVDPAEGDGSADQKIEDKS